MSPTMTEGGIAQWKKKEGEAFSAGDVLLEIETDKATIDVEAQDDGIMGKILAPDGSRNVSVGKVIALLAEEGDDISNLQAPSEPSSSTSQPQASSSAPPPPPTTRPEPSNPTHSASPTHSHKTPSHSRPLFPSVLRLLSENDVANPEEIKGTGVRGMLTKGDVLTYLGKASSPLGSFKAALEAEKKKDERVVAKESGKQPEPVILDGLSVRRVIATNMLEASIKARTMPASTIPIDFDSIIADYLPPSKSAIPPPVSPQSSKGGSNPFEGLL
ncbi:hypothetical protein NLI96_g4204 [Meripilus lineatus]|uniref:Single hybrid motif-containing protein n=1 Tax=Meripilus lineatus TaxID=2056292 RepID=A0AAD5V7D0_9APHY|nr:hypothetical protein NLI96_g4204 [Physisporinus lineatus]